MHPSRFISVFFTFFAVSKAKEDYFLDYEDIYSIFEPRFHMKNGAYFGMVACKEIDEYNQVKKPKLFKDKVTLLHLCTVLPIKNDKILRVQNSQPVYKLQP